MQTENLRLRISWIVILALGLRLVLIVSSSPNGSEYDDLSVYYDTAKQLTTSSDSWLATEGDFGYRAPLYFVYLAGFYTLPFQQTYQVGQVANLLLVIVTLLLLYQLVSIWFGAATATLAVLLRAVLPTFVISDSLLLSELLFNVFFLLVLLFLPFKRSDAHRMRDAFFVGLAGGAAVLTREYAQGLVLVFLVLMLVGYRGRRNKLKAGFMVALGLFVVTAPWLLRNATVWGSPFPLMATSGVNLHIGNHPHATATYSTFQHPDHVTPDDIAHGSRQYDRWHFGKAMSYILESPTRFMVMGIKKIGFLVWPYSMRGELLSSGLFPGLSRTLLLPMSLASASTYALLWILGLAGLLARRLDGYSWALFSLFAYTLAVVFISFGAPRQASPFMLMLLAPAASTLMNPRTVYRSVRRSPKRTFIVSGSLGLLGLLWIVTVLNRRGL